MHEIFGGTPSQATKVYVSLCHPWFERVTINELKTENEQAAYEVK